MMSSKKVYTVIKREAEKKRCPQRGSIPTSKEEQGKSVPNESYTNFVPNRTNFSIAEKFLFVRSYY
jgi:hypothetical protein